MLSVERSNRTEKLLAALALRWASSRHDPLAPAVVVVQGQGMERWIAQALAREQGVCANTEFLFPRNLLERVLGASRGQGSAAADSRWEPRQLVWWLARRLETHRDAPELARLAPPLRGVDGDWRLLQLAHQLAHLFDRYITDRPDRVLLWPSVDLARLDPEERWQAWLFRGLVEDLGSDHLAGRAASLVERLRSEDSAVFASGLEGALPEAIEVFAVSTLAPLYLDVLDALATRIDVHLSILSPSRVYWGDLWRELRDEESVGRVGTGIAPETETGTGASGLFTAPRGAAARLLVGLGRLGGDFQLCLEQRTTYRESGVDLFEDPTSAVGDRPPSLLARLQANFLDLEDGWTEVPVSPDDDSIRVHLCHGPKRELEVVESLLREAFERDPSLTPEDVIVMAPRIETLAPYVEAVFGVPGEDESAIPHRIADRSTFSRSPVAEAFARLLEMLSGRAGRSEVLGWLAREPVRARFGLGAAEVDRLAEWAERAGIRFGLDAAHRADLGLTESPLHTWSGGLDRLALAHAVGASDAVHAGLTPEPLDELSDPSLLGAVGELQAGLAAARLEIGRPRSVEAWCDWLTRLLEETVSQDDVNAHEHTTIRSVLLEMGTTAREAGFDSAMPFEAIRERVLRALELAPPPQGFLSGGVTFCELVPLRAIPFRVIAILGLSDADFPRGRPAPSHDLVARDPRPGDRSPRQDDRHLFLEALLSARDRLILTVPGRDLRDGSDLPPSVVVSDLIDALEESFTLAADTAQIAATDTADEGGAAGRRERPTLREWLVVAHPLQSFSERYFEEGGDSRLAGRDREAFEGARARRQARLEQGGGPRRFLDAPIARPLLRLPDERPQLSIEALCDRILRSSRHFARDRLGLRLPRPERISGDLDPATLDGLERYRLGSAFLEHLEAGASIEEAERRLEANVLLPAGVPGRLAARDLRREVERILEVASKRRAGSRLDDRSFDLDLETEALGKVRITGTLDDLWPGGRVRLAFTRIGGAGDLELWIRHLVLCACLEEEELACPPESFLVGRPTSGSEGKRVVRLAPVSEPDRPLATLFEWAWSADEAPLPFFPKSSRRYVEKHVASGPAIAWREAQGELFGRDALNDRPAEIERDLETRRVWEGLSPVEMSTGPSLRYRFEELASGFFEPLLRARTESTE